MTMTALKMKAKSAGVALAEGQGNRNTDEELAKLRIYRLTKENPRREGSHGYNSFSLIKKDGMRVSDYLTQGGRMRDLRWDIAHGHVEVR